MGEALGRWREQLEAWALPDEILDGAPESPWGFPPELFAQRAQRVDAAPDTPSRRRAQEALAGDGTVLDVGAGGGAASLPLAPPARRIVAVDPSAELLAAFGALADDRGIELETVEGSWPEVAPDVEPADVVVCHHVLYNVSVLAPFADALSGHARRRVVVEITREHPLAWMNDLWRRFHGLDRPLGPTAGDAEAALREAGIRARREDFEVEASSGDFRDRAGAVALARRRLCLPADRDDEVAEALGGRLWDASGRWSAAPRTRLLTTLWWEPERQA